jgi:hypothetical protein
VTVEMPSLEQYFNRNERLHSAIIPRSGLFGQIRRFGPGGWLQFN